MTTSFYSTRCCVKTLTASLLACSGLLAGSTLLPHNVAQAQQPDARPAPTDLPANAPTPAIPAAPATTARTTAPAAPAAATAASDEGSGIRLALQARLDTLHVSGISPLPSTTVPIVTPGVRLLDDLLFVGLGIEFYTVSDGGAKGFALSPLVTYDLLSENWAALYVAGWVNLGTQNPEGPVGSHFLFGANVGVGVRAKVHHALAVGTEWGWAFSVVDDGPFSQGIFGTILLEASYGI